MKVNNMIAPTKKSTVRSPALIKIFTYSISQKRRKY
nr:MAG TPA: hypothetical protein [Caudoviricetes sp.]